MLTMLAQGEMNVGALAEHFPMTLNGVSKHVKVLEYAGLIIRTIHGREHRLRLQPAPLLEAEDWLKHYRAFWEDRLALLEDVLTAAAPPAEPNARTRRRRRPRK
jgi:DNA-binding transcriptional ArsR family regulator